MTNQLKRNAAWLVSVGVAAGLLTLALRSPVAPPAASVQAQQAPTVTEWLAYGQTVMAVGEGIDDPQTNTNGLVGEIAFPYVVPQGKRLVIEAMGQEGYEVKDAATFNYTGITNIFVWVEKPGEFADPPYTPAYRVGRALATCAACKGSNELLGQRVIIPAGYKVHCRISNGSKYAGTYGWYVRGHVEDVPG